MNWLAHLYLSEPDTAFRVGNLLPDWLPPQELLTLPEEFQRGIQRHRHIDEFTDRHPVFRRSVARFERPFRRYGAVLTDVFYDHFLALHWEQHCSASLKDFVHEFYASVDSLRSHIPPQAWEVLEHMRMADWLCSYQEVDGIATTLWRMSQRLRFPFDLSASVKVLEQHYTGFQEDFEAFFPAIQKELLG